MEPQPFHLLKSLSRGRVFHERKRFRVGPVLEVRSKLSAPARLAGHDCVLPLQAELPTSAGFTRFET
jgi:hypothetical protein